MNAPQVYVGIQTGNHYATFCQLGRHVVKRTHKFGGKCCTSMFCVCSVEEDVSFRPATATETDSFWVAMDGLAAEAACRY